MQPKTSFFNKTVLKKDITRFAPIWSIYTVFLLLMLFGMTGYVPAILAANVLEFPQAMVVINALYAGVCAAFLFMDLFNGRLCNALHAFPLRRENWLTIHILSGLLFSFVPNLLATGLASLLLQEYAYIAPIWLAISTLQHLFFFGSAVLCAICAGNLIGMTALYGIFHLITLLIAGLAELFYEPFLYGVKLNINTFTRFFPLEQMNAFQYAEFEVKHDAEIAYGVFHGLIGKQWLYVGLCAAAGVICLALAWLVYRKRNLEAAGDLLSIKGLSPLFLLICTVGAGSVLYLFSGAFGTESYVFMAVGTIVGYFAGSMLLSRTVKVFTKRSLLGFGIIVIAITGTMLLTRLDPLGISRYVPALEKIESAAVIGADKGYYYSPTDSILSYNGKINDSYYQITDQQELQSLQDFHKELIRIRPDTKNTPLCEVNICYTLKNGRIINRYYKVEQNSKLGRRAGEYFNDMRYIFEINDPSLLYKVFESVVIEGYKDDNTVSVKLTDQEEIAGLLDAIKKDCEAGLMAQNWAYHGKYEENYYLDFSVDSKASETLGWNVSRKHLRVWTNSVNTTAYLQQMIAAHAEE